MGSQPTFALCHKTILSAERTHLLKTKCFVFRNTVVRSNPLKKKFTLNAKYRYLQHVNKTICTFSELIFMHLENLHIWTKQQFSSKRREHKCLSQRRGAVPLEPIMYLHKHGTGESNQYYVACSDFLQQVQQGVESQVKTSSQTHNQPDWTASKASTSDH